jgi:hypothetical protein
VAQLLPVSVLAHLTAAQRATLLGKEFFTQLISGPFMSALHIVFIFSACLCVVAALASFLRGQQVGEITPRRANALVEEQVQESKVPSVADYPSACGCSARNSFSCVVKVMRVRCFRTVPSHDRETRLPRCATLALAAVTACYVAPHA